MKNNMEWQPIETAPKDGRDLLLYNPVGWGHFIAMWDSKSQQWYTGFEEALLGSGYQYKIAATHWMPLPPPPPTKEQSE